MDISVTISVSNEDVKRLRISLGTHGELDKILEAVIRAGATEFLSQATGRVVPSGIREARIYRVFLMLQAGVALNEAPAIVAAIFKETPVRARGLVQAAIARYDVELRASVDTRVADVLKKATWNEGRWDVELPVGFVRDRILDFAGATPLADPTRAGRGVVYQFPDETYQAVRQEFGLEPRAKPAKK